MVLKNPIDSWIAEGTQVISINQDLVTTNYKLRKPVVMIINKLSLRAFFFFT